MVERKVREWVAFGNELRRLRSQAGTSLDQAARSLTITGGMLGKIERGTRVPKRDTVEELDQLFGTNGALLRRWSDAVNHAADPAWFRQVTESEKRAIEIRSWAPLLIPGFLQVPDYARAVFTAGRPLDTAEEVERLVDGRIERHQSLTTPGGPALWVVLDESVLTRVIGGPTVMRHQLAALLDQAESGRVRVQVVPFATLDSPGNSGPFRVLTFEEGSSLVYAEGSGGGQILDDLPEVRRHIAIYGELQACALPPSNSSDVIRKVHDGL